VIKIGFFDKITVETAAIGAMRLRTCGRDFELPSIKYEFNKRNFIVRSHFNYE